MKRTFLTFFVFAAFICINVYGQETDSASVDIRAILGKQIADIRSKQEAEAAADTVKETKEEVKTDIIAVEKTQKAEMVSAENLDAAVKTVEFLPQESAVKLFVIIEVIMFTGLVLMWLRKTRKNKKRQISILKNNIKSLREEKIGSRHETNLSKLRNSLRFETIKINDNGKDITSRARKNQISKGEVHLAAKIKLLAGEYR